MKVRTDKDILRFLGLSLGMVLLGLITWRFQFYRISGGLILGGIILLLMFFFIGSKPKEYFIQDERSLRVNEKAGYHSFWIVIWSIGFFTIVDWHSKLMFKDVGGPLYIIGGFSWIILRWYYNKKGEETKP